MSRPTALPEASRASENGRSSRALLARLDDPLSWTGPEKCLFVAGIYVTFTVWYFAMMVILSRRPDVAPYVDRTFLTVALAVQLATILAWTAVVVAALHARRKGREPRAIIAATILIATSELVWWSYILGLHTNLFGGLTIVASLAVGWVLFDRRAINAAAAAVLLAFVCLGVVEQLGWLPYAPLIKEAPFRAGVLDRSWLITMGGLTFVMMLFLLAILYFIVDRWHDREHKLAHTSEQLARANDIISRYVASQLAERIRAGNYDALDRHERRRLTLFFSDIEDFAETADHIEPEDLSEVLNEYLSEMARIGERHGGTIDKFAGDAVMIFFGAPLAMEDRDQALRAVRMAIEMQQRMVVLREKWLRQGLERPFHIRIGINTGRASIGNFGSKERADYTAIGRHVNLAARLQAQCSPDFAFFRAPIFDLRRGATRSAVASTTREAWCRSSAARSSTIRRPSAAAASRTRASAR